MADFRATLLELEKLVEQRRHDVDGNRHIHIAWICIQEGGDRVEDAEIDLHSMLSRYMPVVGVVTKAISDNGFRQEVQSLLPQTKNVVRVLAQDKVLDGGIRIPAHGLEALVGLTLECVPEAHRRAFTAAQKASLKQKAKEAHVIVGVAATSAGAAGATPIPFADAFILVPIQVGMIAGISATYGLEMSTAFLSTLLTSAAGGTATTFGGRALVTNLLKIFPGAGTVAGGVIAAATAVALTAAMGEAYIATLSALYEESGGETPSNRDVADRFAESMSLKR